MPEVRSIREADISGKRILMRVDFNVPIKGGKVLDDMRLRAVIPTLTLLHDKGAANIILITHVGRPEGKVVEELRVAPIDARLRELTQVPFELRENLRFDPREEVNDEAFAKELATLGDIFVNDAFAVSHRFAASIIGVAKILPAYAGLLMEKEIEQLSKALTPPRGSLAIIGGAKFETKQPLIEKLLSLYDKVLLGGALGNDVLKARGSPVGASLVSVLPVPTAVAGNDRLWVATDAAVVNTQTQMGRSALINDVRAGESILDIGPATAQAWSKEVAQAPFVLWSGPMGVYEKGFTEGTDALAQALVDAGTGAVVGGGDTAAAIQKFSFDPNKVFISTGGGAVLQFLVDGTLPGIEALKK